MPAGVSTVQATAAQIPVNRQHVSCFLWMTPLAKSHQCEAVQFSKHPVTGEPVGFFGVFDGELRSCLRPAVFAAPIRRRPSVAHASMCAHARHR